MEMRKRCCSCALAGSIKVQPPGLFISQQSGAGGERAHVKIGVESDLLHRVGALSQRNTFMVRLRSERK